MKSIKTIVVVSLLINALLIGGIVGNILRFGGPPRSFAGHQGPPPMDGEFGGPPGGPMGQHGPAHDGQFGPMHDPMMAVLPLLPEDKRQTFMDTIKMLHQSHLKQMNDIQDEAFTVFTAEKFDAGKMKATMAKLDEVHDDIHNGLTQLIVDIAKDMSQSDRIKLAQALKETMPSPQ